MSNNKKKPDQLLIYSMALRYRHDFGILTFEEQQSIRVTMTQLWEEVVGLGFYKPKHKTMSNNKQSMKLYTEEQILEFLKVRTVPCTHRIIFDSEDLEELTPIELPSDEEIEEKCNSLDGYEFNSHENAFFGGAKWMRDKIKGGNK